MSAGPHGQGVRPRRDRLSGVYVHVPFCAKICPYCDFAVTARKAIPHEPYADAVLSELAARQHELRGRDVRTIYLGGGTPSLWSHEALGRTLDGVRAAIDAGSIRGASAVQEVTMEANPLDLTPERLDRWHAQGITRLSLGTQSFQNATLAALGRLHDGVGADRAVRMALAHGGFEVSCDLIFGGPAQPLDAWARDLDAVADLIAAGLHHVSAYALTIEANTPFARAAARGELRVADEDGQADRLDALVACLEGAGLRRYEVASFARPDRWSRHNALYWLGGEYLGLGVGAHGLWLEEGRVVRRANTRHLNPYLKTPQTPAITETISPADHLLERVATGLRTHLGLDLDALHHQLAHALPPGTLDTLRDQLDALTARGLLEPLETPRTGWRPSPRGWDVVDGMVAALASPSGPLSLGSFGEGAGG